MKNTVRILAAGVLIAGAGLVHGAWTNRWGASPALLKLAGRLQTLPKVLGDWTSVDREMDSRELGMTGAVGYISRRYTNRAKGISLDVLLLTGLPGHIASHTPEACYPGAGYALGEPEGFTCKYGPEEKTAQFRTAIAAKAGPSPFVLRIYWSWHGTKGWSAPEDARWTFSAEPRLTKLYLVRENSGAKVDPKTDPCNEFMTIILPELDRLISEPSHSSEATQSAAQQ
jgi:hypothetical protein